MDPRRDVSRLVWPALRASRGEAAVERLRRVFASGPAGGVIVFGEGAERVDRLIARLRLACSGELLVSADLERGCGQHVRESTSLPPAMALSACTDDSAARAAGRLTASEARAAGIDVVFAPVADVNSAARNPIIATRSFGDDPRRVATLATAFAEGLGEGGALSVAKHYPGHGSTVQDSHAELARVTHGRDRLEAVDLVPFRALVGAGVPGLMVGHLETPALDPVRGRPATLSPAVVREHLRGELGFSGLVVTDALDMAGFPDHPDAPRRALEAGCDVLLMPRDPLGTVERLRADLDAGRLDPGLVVAALARLDEAGSRLREQRARSAPPSDPTLAESLLLASLTRGGAPFEPPAPEQRVEIETYGEDPTGIVVPAFEETLEAHGVALGPSEYRVAVVMTSVRARLGSARLDPLERERLEWAVGRRRHRVVVVLGSPYELLDLPPDQPAVLAYEPTAAAAAAAARVVLGRCPAPGRLPVGAGP